MAGIRPGKYNPLKPDIELFDFKSKKRYGLKLDGSGALQVGTISQDDSVHIRSAGKRIGDFDEQRSWKGGRGIEKLDSNADGFWDSQNAWTLSENHIHPTLLWQFARGLRACDFSMPSTTKSLSWRQLLGSSLYVAIPFVASSSFTSAYVRVWVRRIGTPGTLTFRLLASNGSVLQTATVDTTTITDYISVLQRFSIIQSLTNGTTYYASIFGASTDNKNNHWEVGGYSLEGLSGSPTYTGVKASDGVNFTGDTFDMYYYIADADIARTFYTFFLDDAMYVVDKKDDGTASQLYINGDRGKATSGSLTNLTDSSKSWTTNRWAGARVKIVRGTGLGSSREIVSNTATALTLASSGKGSWPIVPDSTSEYVIYSTEWFSEITSTGLSRVISQPLVVNQIVYFPQSPGAFTRVMVWNATVHAFQNDGTNGASFMVKSSDSSGTRIWRVTNASGVWNGSTISYATAVAGSAAPAALTFSTAKDVGDVNYFATGMLEKEGIVYIFKEDGVWKTDNTAALVKLGTGMGKTPSKLNGVASIAHQQFIFYSWLHSVIRVYGSSHDDIGQDWSGKGLPDSREGGISSLDAYTSLLIAGIDAGVGTSSVLGFDGLGWHELLRAYDSNKSIRMTKVQACIDARNRLWTEIGGDLVFQEMPYMKGSPRLDSGARYMHEFVVESSTIDMGTASGLSKFIKELTVYAENLGNGNEIYVDFQTDDNVHKNVWTNATTLFDSPESTAFLGLNNIRAFAYRLRVVSRDNTLPVNILGVIPNGYARAPYKMVWTLRCKADNITSRGRLVKPDMLMRWLLDNARFPGRIEMQSQYELAHKFNVIIHPPRMFPYKPASNGQSEESVFTIVLEEA